MKFTKILHEKDNVVFFLSTVEAVAYQMKLIAWGGSFNTFPMLAHHGTFVVFVI